MKYKEKQLHKNKHIIISEKNDVLTMNFTGTSSSKEYRESLLKFIEFASHKKEQKRLWNQKKMSVFPQDWEWTVNDWLAMSIDKLGETRKIAFISSQSFYLEYEMKNFFRFLHQNHQTIQVEAFDDVHKAEKWLSS